MIGIIGAMEMEVEGIRAAMGLSELMEISSIDFYLGRLFGKETVVAKCGPGKVNAAVCAQTMILEFEPDFIVNPGVAGGIGPGVKIGDLVIGSSCVQHDADTTALGEPRGTLTLKTGEIQNLPCNETLSDLFHEKAKGVYRGEVHRGVIATGDQFVADGQKCLELQREFSALACEMESGAIAQVCHMAGVPFVALRSISDNANESGKVDFLTFARESAEKTVELLNAAVSKL